MLYSVFNVNRLALIIVILVPHLCDTHNQAGCAWVWALCVPLNAMLY